ncbi:MAG: hypothetical protein U5R06_03680 [candidate division KSB1 bacterium]|nr:hypothetical protein [candidate division KSB1 bacterium]
MTNITLKKTHDLLEKLADYVMNEVPTRKEMQQRYEAHDKRFEQIERRLEQIEQQKADKSDVQKLLEGMDHQSQQLDIIRIELKAISGTLDNHEKRLADLEVHNFGSRVRDKNKPSYKR